MAISGIIDTTSLTNLVNSNLSEDLKLKGANKIGQIISDQGNKISTLMLPLALNFAKELGIDTHWHYIVFSYNEHEVDRCRDLARSKGIKIQFKLTAREMGLSDSFAPINKKYDWRIYDER